jgi:hypothetical protein
MDQIEDVLDHHKQLLVVEHHKLCAMCSLFLFRESYRFLPYLSLEVSHNDVHLTSSV